MHHQGRSLADESHDDPPDKEDWDRLYCKPCEVTWNDYQSPSSCWACGQPTVTIYKRLIVRSNR